MWLNTATTSAAGPRLLIPLSYFCCLWFIFILFHSCSMANAEFYSSIDSLKTLGNTEATLLQIYRQYLKQQQRDIAIVKRFIGNVKLQLELAKADVADYIGNPINAFLLIKRMIYDWKELCEFLKLNDAKMDIDESLTQFKENFKLLDENELQGAINGLWRLQDVYKLSAKIMASGERYGKVLDWRDCFEIGATLLDHSSFAYAIDWLDLSLLKLQESKESNNIKSLFTTNIKENLALAYQGFGKPEKAIQYLDNILENDPESSAKLIKNHFLNTETNTSVASDVELQMEFFGRLCRGEGLRVNRNMNCKLDFNLHPFFTLSPLQVEPVLTDPPVTLYYNMLNDEQISKFLQEIKNYNMERSKVFSVSGGEIVETRVSQQTWAYRQKSNITNMLYKMVEVMTGFNLTNAELLQVANYGIGGQYNPHYDYLGSNYTSSIYVGDRIATNMFYLSDVEEGGYTIFPYLDVYTKPVKGAMIMWYNLHKSLAQDERTLHGGCPVLKGNKIIANIWTHSGYQEFKKPCGLINDSLN